MTLTIYYYDKNVALFEIYPNIGTAKGGKGMV